MIESVYNHKFQGITEEEVKKGIKTPDWDVEYDPSLTDQTFDVSVRSQVEDFIASGKIIEAIHQSQKSPKEVDVADRIDSFYGDDLPDVTQRIYAFDEKQKKKESEAKKKKEEEERIKELVSSGPESN